MPKDRHAREESCLRAIVPWLSRQLGDDLKWLGRPEDPDYTSACNAARSLQRPLDAELEGEHLHVVLEHTTLDSFSKQRRLGALFAQLGAEIRSLSHLVPQGNGVRVGYSPERVDKALTEKRLRAILPKIIEKLRAYLEKVPANPTRNDVIRGQLLEEQEWPFDGLVLSVSRFLWPSAGHISLVCLVGGEAWDCGVARCLNVALSAKLKEKAASYRAYRSAGWLCILVLQAVDWQLSSPDIVGRFFAQMASDFDLALVDGIVIVQQVDDLDKSPECCWAYFDGEVRTEWQQYREVADCLGIEPNS